jgi:DNA-binding transcriptional MerR regulator
MEKTLPPIPEKRYFTIGEVGELCGVKPHVLRYWEQEFTQLRPMKRRGNRRYYQHHEVLMIRSIRDLLYDQGFTISGARNKLQELVQSGRETPSTNLAFAIAQRDAFAPAGPSVLGTHPPLPGSALDLLSSGALKLVNDVRHELLEIRDLLGSPP